MWTRGWVTSLLGARVYLYILTPCALCLCPAGRADAGLSPATSTSGQSSTSETDKAYYLSTTIVQQELGALYNRPESAAVPQWGCFEKTVTNSRPYDNPYEDVTLAVKLTRPDGGTVDLWGFYSGQQPAERGGGGIWSIRFMPEQAGTWHYEARFSDGSGQASGTFLCVVPSPRAAGSGGSVPCPPGLISAYKSNPIWFGFKGGGAVLVRSFQVGDRFLADADNPLTGQSWSPAQRKAFLDWAQKQGYNMLAVPSCFLNANSPGRGKGWNTPALWDAKRQQPDCGEYRRLETVLDDLAERGMLVYPLGGLFGRDCDFPKDEAKQDLYIRYTLARLGRYWNLLLNVGGPELPLRGTAYLNADEVNRLGRQMSASNGPGLLLSADSTAGDDPFKDSSWASFGVLRGPYTTDLKQLSRVVLRNHDKPKPLYACDALWALGNRRSPYTPTELRKRAYVLMMSAATINFADTNADLASGFSGTLDLKQKVQARHDILKNAWDYFDRIPFWRLKPRQDLVNTGYCLAEPGQRYLVYLDRPGTVTVKIDEGSYQVAWINARDTNEVRKAGIIDGRRALTSPQEQDDWLLSLVRVEITGGAIREH